MEAESVLETSVTPAEFGRPGSIDVWLSDDRENTYLGGWYGTAEEIGQRIEEDEFFGLAAYIEKNVGGDVAYLAGMEVGEEKTRRGIGSAMFEAFVELARQEHVDVIFLHRSAGTRSSDEQLRKFYSRLGFRNVRCCARDVWPVMKLEI